MMLSKADVKPAPASMRRPSAGLELSVTWSLAPRGETTPSARGQLGRSSEHGVMLHYAMWRSR